MIITTKFEIGDKVLMPNNSIGYIEAIKYIHYNTVVKGIVSYYVSDKQSIETKKWIDETELTRINTKFSLGDIVYHLDDDNTVEKLIITKIMYVKPHVTTNTDDGFITYETVKNGQITYSNIKEDELYSSMEEINNYISKTIGSTKENYVIIDMSYTYPELAIDEDGDTLVFKTKEAAEKAAKEYQSYKIVQI